MIRVTQRIDVIARMSRRERDILTKTGKRVELGEGERHRYFLRETELKGEPLPSAPGRRS
jgi:hypothetical protein